MISTADLQTYEINIELLKGHPGSLLNLITELQLMGQIENEAASGAIGIKLGTALITKSSAAAVMTLALPTAGVDDGKTLDILSISAQAHTVTTPVHGLNTNKNVTTFGGAVGDKISLIAYNGTWYVKAQTNQTLSGS